MRVDRRIPPPTTIAGGNSGAMPNASKTKAYHSVAQTHAAAPDQPGRRGFNGVAACASARRKGPRAQKISAAMTAAAIARAVTGGV